jgi:hypothetical protein
MGPSGIQYGKFSSKASVQPSYISDLARESFINAFQSLL